MDLTNLENLAGVLSMLNENDTSKVKSGEKMLKPFVKKTQCIFPLFNVLKSVDNQAIRLQAALLLKKKIATLYPKLNINEKQEVRNASLACLLSEPENVVSTGIAGIVANMARAIFSSNENWKELFDLLIQLYQDPNEKLRILNYKLLEQVS